MSKDSSNPFAQLRIADFPAKAAKARSAAPKKKAAAGNSQAEDERLFLEALGSGMNVFRDGGRKHEDAPYREEDDFRNALPIKKPAAAKAPAVKAEGPKPVHVQAAGPAASVPDGSAAAQERKKNAAAGPAPAEEEGTAFMDAMRDVAPLHASGRDVNPEAKRPANEPGPLNNPLQDFIEGKIEFAVENREGYVEGHIVGLDAGLVEQLRSRRFSYEAHIDLHGLNSEQAYWNLVGFFRSAYFKGLRVVLIITGRGLNSPFNEPVLRGKVQQWMSHEPLKRVVLAFCSAKQEDGGLGALYVLLRKRKKNAGKISWDLAPDDSDLYD